MADTENRIPSDDEVTGPRHPTSRFPEADSLSIYNCNGLNIVEVFGGHEWKTKHDESGIWSLTFMGNPHVFIDMLNDFTSVEDEESNFEQSVANFKEQWFIIRWFDHEPADGFILLYAARIRYNSDHELWEVEFIVYNPPAV